jgi:hypothetical protein
MSVTALTAGLTAGGAFGVKHAMEADHVAAVASLVERDEHSATTGAAWGVGHSVPILALGAGFLALGAELPPAAATAAEWLVAAVLVVLGVRAMAGREAMGTALVRHVHGDSGDGSSRDGHDHAGDTGHTHLQIGATAVGLGHTHAAEESFGVGIVHGLAGSGGIVVALAAGSGATFGTGFLGGFAVATVAAMAAAAWGWGRAVGESARLRVVAGAASVGVGLLLAAELAGYATPL